LLHRIAGICGLLLPLRLAAHHLKAVNHGNILAPLLTVLPSPAFGFEMTFRIDLLTLLEVLFSGIG